MRSPETRRAQYSSALSRMESGSGVWTTTGDSRSRRPPPGPVHCQSRFHVPNQIERNVGVVTYTLNRLASRRFGFGGGGSYPWRGWVPNEGTRAESTVPASSSVSVRNLQARGA